MMYVVYNKDHIHYLLNESKTWIFTYICDRKCSNWSFFIFMKVIDCWDPNKILQVINSSKK